MACSLLERRPHFLVALRGPDTWVAMSRGLIIGTRDIERQAMIEDRPMAILRLQPRIGLLVDLPQFFASSRSFLHRSIQLRDERAGALETLADLGGCLAGGASPPPPRPRLHSRHPLECARPLRAESIPRLGGCLELPRGPGERHLIPRAANS